MSGERYVAITVHLEAVRVLGHESGVVSGGQSVAGPRVAGDVYRG
jgi:hypothetical protein